MGFGNTHKKKHTQISGSARSLPYKSEKDGLSYAITGLPRGDCMFDITLVETAKKTWGSIAGSLVRGPNKKRIFGGMYVLVQKDSSSTGKDKYFIVHAYSDDDVRRLRKEGELAPLTDDAVFEEVVIDSKFDLPENEELDEVDISKM
jgi:hypothetical protein